MKPKKPLNEAPDKFGYDPNDAKTMHTGPDGKPVAVYDYGEMRTLARNTATGIVLKMIEKQFLINKKGDAKITEKMTQQLQESNNFLVTYHYRDRFIRCAWSVSVDKATVLNGWSVIVEARLDDSKNLLIPRSKIKIKSHAKRLESLDFAYNFHNEFWKILNYYQAIVQLEWSQVGTFDLIRTTVSQFLQKLGLVK